MKKDQFKMRPETVARYRAQHDVAQKENAPRRILALQSEIGQAVKDGEPDSYIAWLSAKVQKLKAL